MTIDDVMSLADKYADAAVELAPKKRAGDRIGRDELRAAILALLAESDGPWKRVVIEKLIVSHCYKNAHEDDPEAAVNDLISWEVAVALDPCVSSDAVKLLDAEAEACHAIVSEEDLRWDAMDRIRARIDARKTKENSK